MKIFPSLFKKLAGFLKKFFNESNPSRYSIKIPGKLINNPKQILNVEKIYLNDEIFSWLKTDVWKPESDKSEKINEWTTDNIKYNNCLNVSIKPIFWKLIFSINKL